jgi:dihydrofolate reductase
VKTQYYTASSLDGYIADENHSLDWLFQFGDENATDYPDFIRDVGAIVMGRSTYDWVLENDTLRDPDNPKPWPYTQPCWVFTNREATRLNNADIRFVRGNVTTVHEEMAKASGGKNIWVVGGGDLVGQFHDAGLLDEIIVTFAAVTLGKGMPLLPRRIVTPPLKLIGIRTFGDIYAQVSYAVQRADRKE